jgi:hypothetical protein
MARGDYEGSGEAFLGATSLGRLEWRLHGFENHRMRKADGSANFEDGVPPDCIGRQLRIVPEDGGKAFTLVVTAAGTSGVTVASDGEMPWWN